MAKKDKAKKAARRAAARDRMRKSNQKDSNSSSIFVLPSGVKLFVPKEGRNKISIIPFIVADKHNYDDVPKGELWYRRKYFQHRNIGPNNDRVVCLKTFGKPCPICEKCKEMYNDVDVDDKLAKELTSSARAVYNVKYKGDITLYDVSIHCFGKQLQKELNDLDDDDDRWSFWDSEDGFDVKARFEEDTVKKTKFLKCDRIDFMERDDLDEDILNEAIDLDTLFIEESYDSVKEKLYGIGDDEGEAEQDSDGAEDACPECGEDRDDCCCEHEETKKEEVEEPKDDDEGDETEEGVCPLDDSKFGIDFDEWSDCDDCEQKKACEKAFDAIPGVDEEQESDKGEESDNGDEDEDDGKDSCPHGKWMGDCDNLDECDVCPKWSRCRDSADKADVEAKKGGKKSGKKSGTKKASK